MCFFLAAGSSPRRLGGSDSSPGGMGGVPHQGGPSPSGGRGRGRDLVKPAWMTAESSAGAEEKTSETN